MDKRVPLKHIRLEKKRLERFAFAEVSNVRVALQTKPNLEKELLKDFEGRLKAEGVVIDNNFKNRIRNAWRSQISTDIREAVAKSPPSTNLYLRKVVKGEPLVVHVEVDPETGKLKKTVKEEP